MEKLHPIVARGVLLDIAGLKGVEAMEAGVEITMTDVRAALKRQGMEDFKFMPGTSCCSAEPRLTNGKLLRPHRGLNFATATPRIIIAGRRMRTNFVLVDFENIQPEKPSLLVGSPFKVKIKIFLGANQTKVPLEVVREIQPFGPDAEYIQIDGSGSNALDFHITYYIGRLAVEHADAYFHVISKDTGFDPLIKHLRSRKIFCKRSTSISETGLLKVSISAPDLENAEAIIDDLAERRASRP